MISFGACHAGVFLSPPRTRYATACRSLHAASVRGGGAIHRGRPCVWSSLPRALPDGSCGSIGPTPGQLPRWIAPPPRRSIDEAGVIEVVVLFDFGPPHLSDAPRTRRSIVSAGIKTPLGLSEPVSTEFSALERPSGRHAGLATLARRVDGPATRFRRLRANLFVSLASGLCGTNVTACSAQT